MTLARCLLSLTNQCADLYVGAAARGGLYNMTDIISPVCGSLFCLGLELLAIFANPLLNGLLERLLSLIERRTRAYASVRIAIRGPLEASIMTAAIRCAGSRIAVRSHFLPGKFAGSILIENFAGFLGGNILLKVAFLNIPSARRHQESAESGNSHLIHNQLHLRLDQDGGRSPVARDAREQRLPPLLPNSSEMTPRSGGSRHHIVWIRRRRDYRRYRDGNDNRRSFCCCGSLVNSGHLDALPQVR